MGIQLPPELADVAAKAGVKWPEADEDAMRASATAWREAGTRITGLAGESDTSATRTLTSITGSTADAARGHWDRVVAPDGDLNTAAKGCHAAADRLEHGADQIGATKVALVRELVDLAKNNDAAQQCASAGHPTALLGLDTALAGATANVNHLTNTLASSVRLDSGVDVGSTTPPVNANPGSHGGLLDVVGGTLDHTVGAVAAPVAAVVAPVADVVPAVVAPVADVVPAVVAPVAGVVPAVVAPVADVVPAVAAPVTDLASHVVAPVADAVPKIAAPVVDLAPQVLAPVDGAVQAVPAAAQPVLASPPLQVPTALVPPVAGVLDGPPVAPVLGAPPVQAPLDAIQPIVGTSDGTVTQASAALLDRPLLPTELQAPAQAAAQPQAPAAPAVPVQGPTQAPSFGTAAPAAPAAPSAPVATGGGSGGAVVGTPVQRADQGAVQRGADQTVAQQRGEQRTPPSQQQSQQSSQSQQSQQSTNPAAKDLKKPDQGASQTSSPDVAAFVYLHAFPRGTAPKASPRPSEQTDPTAGSSGSVESDGLRFRPQDHPHADLVSTRSAQPVPARTPALGPDHPLVRQLSEGYDPQAGLHERDWDGRYLRATEPFGHVWPDADTFPEGGYEAGRPDVLPAGSELDRFGTDEGRVLTTLGTRFAARSLPPEHLAAGYRRYVVRQPLPVWRTVSAPWFGQPGGGTRYRTTYPVADLVALGYLMELS